MCYVVNAFISAEELARLDSITTTIAPESKFSLYVKGILEMPQTKMTNVTLASYTKMTL